jgi:hypothetical protein
MWLMIKDIDFDQDEEQLFCDSYKQAIMQDVDRTIFNPGNF